MVKPGLIVRLPLRAALHRVLAEPVASDTDYPPFDRSIMDGFAVRSRDVTGVPATLAVVGHVAAGDQGRAALQAGQALGISTGAPIPEGCDVVVPVERAEREGDRVVITVAVRSGQFIGRRASAVAAGRVVLQPGVRLGPAQIGVAAAAGRSSLATYRQPSVGILATGSELVEPDRPLVGGQIRDSNRYVLEALVRQNYCRPIDLGVVPDDLAATAERLRRAAEPDVLCTVGGVSMGELDFIPRALREVGVTVHFHKVAIKPGKPVLFATTENGRYVFGLPGNPLSAFTAFWLLVRLALARLQGQAASGPNVLKARLSGAVGATGDRRTFRPARVSLAGDGQLVAEALPSQGSGDPFCLARANALLDGDAQAPALVAGAEVRVILLDEP